MRVPITGIEQILELNFTSHRSHEQRVSDKTTEGSEDTGLPRCQVLESNEIGIDNVQRANTEDEEGGFGDIITFEQSLPFAQWLYHFALRFEL